MRQIVRCLLCLWIATPSAQTWPEATPAEVNMDVTHINAAINMIESGNYGAIRSLVIIKDGYLVTERYFGNQGEKRPVYSVTKSVGSVLLGIAQYQGADIDVNAPMMNYLPQYSDIPNINQANAISLHDLLTQRHGYGWDEWSVPYGTPNNPLSQMLQQSDWYRHALQWPIVRAPDLKFAYSTGHSSLMSPILQQATGEDVYDFATNELFIPLGIEDTHWELIDGGGAQGQGITEFPFGIEPLGFGLWLRPLDMARIGELYRLGGQWQGQRILSQEWIEQSVQRYSDGNSDGDVFIDEYSGYGYQWWTLRFVDDAAQSTDAYYANGYGRQFIMVLPALNSVIVSTADDYGYSGPGIGTVMREQLLLAYDREDTPVPLTHDYNGSWHWPENSGQGIDFQILNDNSTIIGFWYTYDATGGGQRWFTFQGTVQDTLAEFTIYTTSGGQFVEGTAPELGVWGSGSLVIHGCTTGLFQFNSDSEGVAGEIPLSRITAAFGNCLPSNSQAKQQSQRKAQPLGYIH
ncbi:serine hydrolase domain-containing protein [Marinicella meishanensis]|uniref:serine hydrolase domain-containing protein n=1 Tax=Marinicella meishanensis TaxID=2873263 RepID=UPI001CBBC125|nr:serine hydrolase [Marinicella sp. NBU2979]